MRDIKEIVKELEAHPDYIHRGTIWSVDKVIGDISFEISMLTTDEMYDDGSYVNIRSSNPNITRGMFTEEDWSIIKRAIYDLEIQNSMNSITTPYDIKLLSFHTRVVRDIKLNNLGI